jgi:hypothetical protein
MLKNLCNLPHNEAEAIIANLRSSGKRVWLHSGYLKDRHRVEEWLYREFENKGKKPHLRHPLYFVLGENDDFLARMVSSVTKSLQNFSFLWLFLPAT